MAGPLWVEGVTSYDLLNLHQSDVIALLRELRDNPDRLTEMSEAARARFTEVVNFDEDAAKVRALIEANV